LPAYTLTVTLDYDRHFAAVQERIVYLNRTGQAIDRLPLMTDPLYFLGVFTLKGISASGRQVQTKTETGRINLALPKPLAPGETLTLDLGFELNLPQPVASPLVRPVPFGWSPQQANLVDWYPFIPPNIPGKGWIANPASFYGEHLAYEPVDFSVSLRLNGGRKDLIVAASAPEQTDGEWRRYRLSPARSFALSVSPFYQVSRAEADGVILTGYSFPSHTQAGQAALQAAADAVRIYTRLYGTMPRTSLSVVEAGFLDGMEYDGLFFLSQGFYNLYDGKPGSYLIDISAHETAHQWFYGLVGNDQANEPWLDEALCTYSERLFYENAHPESLDWWWNVRVNFYKPHGWVDTNIYNPQAETDAYRAYRDAVYLNGAVFIEELRKQIGDEAFFAFLKDYVSSNSRKTATRQSFFEAVRRHTSQDIHSLTVKYFKNP
jgi:hypothetical protein